MTLQETVQAQIKKIKPTVGVLHGLGVSKSTFWRMQIGDYAIRLSQVQILIDMGLINVTSPTVTIKRPFDVRSTKEAKDAVYRNLANMHYTDALIKINQFKTRT